MSAHALDEPSSMDLSGHLAELRQRILTCLVLFIAAVIALSFQGHVLLRFLEIPAKDAIEQFIFTAPTEAFATYCTVVLLTAFIVCFPVVLYQLWAFVAPAMPRDLRRVTAIWSLFAVVSFFIGIAFAYGILLPSAFSFLVGFGAGIATPMISLSQYISFAVAIIFVGGVAFEIPFVMGMLTEAGFLNSKILRSSRRYAVLFIFILAAVITPTQDPFNMIIFAVPMALLFEVGIIICALIEKRKINMLQEKI